MSYNFVVTKSFKHQVDCFCSDQKHSEVYDFHTGDIVEVTPERKYLYGFGWYFLININEQDSYYIFIKDLETYYDEHKFRSILDLELEMNHLTFQVDQALEMKNEDRFYRKSEELTSLKYFYDEIKVKLLRKQEPNYSI